MANLYVTVLSDVLYLDAFPCVTAVLVFSPFYLLLLHLLEKVWFVPCITNEVVAHTQDRVHQNRLPARWLALDIPLTHTSTGKKIERLTELLLRNVGQNHLRGQDTSKCF